MRRTAVFGSIILASSLAVIASAAPPPGKGGGKGGGGGGGEDPDPPTQFEPEFAGYRGGGRNGSDTIVMVDRTASSEVTVHSTSESIIGLDLSRDDRGLIAFSTLEGGLYLQSWSSGAQFAVSAAELVYQSGDGVISPDFSADGNRVAFIASYQGGRSLYICDIDPVDLLCSSVHREFPLDGWSMTDVRFNQTDSGSVFIEARPPGGTAVAVYKYTLGGPAPSGTPFIAEDPNESWDVGQVNPFNEPLIAMDTNGTARFFRVSDGSEIFPAFAGFGYNYRLNCRNDAVLYAETAAKKQSGIAVTEFGGPVEKLTNKGWNSKRHDWMPRLNCE